jgi:hypothetical protein
MYKSGFDKILTRDIWEQYSGRSCSVGFSFEDCVLPCIMDYGQQFSLKRMFAGSQDSYRKFSTLIYQFLKFYNDERSETFLEAKQYTEDEKKV